MTHVNARDTVGCLYIGELVPGTRGSGALQWAAGLPGVDMRPFRFSCARTLWDDLQTELQKLRAAWGDCAVMAGGSGCAAALALASQLPVERIVLLGRARPVRLSPMTGPSINGDDKSEAVQTRRVLSRLAGFARRNLSLCVSDILIVEQGTDDGVCAFRRAFGDPVNCRIRRMAIRDGCAKDLYTIREFAVKEAISRYLHGEEAPKPLAENSDLCIIYG